MRSPTIAATSKQHFYATHMASNPMSKNGSIFIGLISFRRTVTFLMLLVVCLLAPWSHSATADEINATTTAKPVGFAEIVAKVTCRDRCDGETGKWRANGKRGTRHALAIPAI